MRGRLSTIVESAIEALNRGDWNSALEFTAPDFEYDISRTASPLAGIYRREQMREVADEFLGSWERAQYEPHELIEAGDRVVMPFTTHFHGRQGIVMASEAVWVWSFRGDTVTRITLFQDRDEALAAAGD